MHDDPEVLHPARVELLEASLDRRADNDDTRDYRHDHDGRRANKDRLTQRAAHVLISFSSRRRSD